jgi:hypothetical protein
MPPPVRFTKVFTRAEVNFEGVDDLEKIEKLQRQTIFVIQAGRLSDFLEQCTRLEDQARPWHQ